MAGNWIKWCKGLAKKREVLVISSRLKRDRHEIAGRLMSLWEWCDENMDDADFDGEDAILSLGDRDTVISIIDHESGVAGIAEALCDKSVDWLEIKNDGLAVFKKLRRHNGKTAKERASEQRKKAIQRGNGRHSDENSVPPLPGTAKSKAKQSKADNGCVIENVLDPRKDRGMQGGKDLTPGKSPQPKIAAPENSDSEETETPGKNGRVFDSHARDGEPDEIPPAKRPDEGRAAEKIPFGYSDRVWEFRSVAGVLDRPDQHGFMAKLAWADCTGFEFPRPIMDIVGRCKRARSPAGEITHILKLELGAAGWEDFRVTFPSYTHCLWALDEVENGRRQEG